jgi:hypothetical protein
MLQDMSLLVIGRLREVVGTPPVYATHGQIREFRECVVALDHLVKANERRVPLTDDTLEREELPRGVLLIVG